MALVPLAAEEGTSPGKVFETTMLDDVPELEEEPLERDQMSTPAAMAAAAVAAAIQTRREVRRGEGGFVLRHVKVREATPEKRTGELIVTICSWRILLRLRQSGATESCCRPSARNKERQQRQEDRER